METGTHRLEIKAFNAEVDVRIHQKMYDKVCNYRFILNGKEHEGTFIIDPYNKEPIAEILIEKISQRIAINMTMNLVKKSEHYLQKELIG